MKKSQFKEEYMIETIRKGRRNALSMSKDYGLAAPIAVALFTPDMENTDEHYHIEFDRRQAKKLRDWLTKYLNKTARK